MTRAAPFTRPSGGWRPAVASAVENLNPGAFAFVMATGIVSTAFARPGMRTASVVLALIAVVGYVVLWALYLWRLVRWRQRFLADLAGSRGFAFLTFVAASNVLATRLVLGRRYGAAEVLLALGVAGWLVLGYGVPLLLICARRALPLRQVNGTWFLWVVGTESIAVAAASLGPHTGGRTLGALASVCWAGPDLRRHRPPAHPGRVPGEPVHRRGHHGGRGRAAQADRDAHAHAPRPRQERPVIRRGAHHLPPEAPLLLAVWPFTRLVHAWNIPLWYLWRPYIVYRGRVATHPTEPGTSGRRWRRIGARY